MKSILSEYQNGNFLVRLYDDGTQERICGNNELKPEFPCSLDVKITNWCDAGCSYCYEKSTLQGKHGDLEKLLKVLDLLPDGIEICVGGGNPLSHPEVDKFVLACKKKNWIVNLTMNQVHLNSYYDKLKYLIENKLIYGLGISYSSSAYLSECEKILTLSPNIVFHLILGINKLSDISELQKIAEKQNQTCKVLLLGYKHFGFGINYYVKNKKIEDNKYNWYTQLPRYFRNQNLVLSFDNLAIQQLNLKRFFTEEAWNRFYLGDDFTTSMYVDAVEECYGASSTSEKRVSFNDKNLLTFFEKKK
jgi:organic radical activating enzyme